MIFGGCVIKTIHLQKHFTGIIQQRLDYIFVSNSLQESVKKNRNSKCSIIQSFPLFSALLLIMILLLMDQVFGNSIILYCSILSLLKKLKTHIEIVKRNFQENSSFSDQSKWEFLKYKICKFSISFSKNLDKTVNYKNKS